MGTAVLPARRRVPVSAWTARAHGGRRCHRARLPGARAAPRRPRGPCLPRRAVRPGGVHDLERAVVRRPSHAGLQRAHAAAVLAGGTAAAARRCRAWRSPFLFEQLVRAPLRSRPRAPRGALARSGHGHAARDRAGSRSRSARRSGWAPLLALQRDRPRSAFVLALLSPLASPVAGLFTGLGRAGLRDWRARAAARPRRHRSRVAALAPPLLLGVAFPEGGWAPFPFTAYLPIPIFCAACLLLLPARRADAARGRGALRPRRHARRLRPRPRSAAPRRASGCSSAVRCCSAPRPIGSGVAPLGCSPWRVAGFALLAYWQWTSAIRDIDKALRDPAADSDYFEPLRAVPLHAARPAPDRDPVHEQPLGERRGGADRAAGARLAAPARHRPQPGLLPRRPQPPHVRELAGRERGALRGAAEREAGQELVRASGP